MDECEHIGYRSIRRLDADGIFQPELAIDILHTLSRESETLIPPAVTLYANQFQQFLIPRVCRSVTAGWSMSAGMPGILRASGLYVAPASINSQSTVTITGGEYLLGSQDLLPVACRVGGDLSSLGSAVTCLLFFKLFG